MNRSNSPVQPEPIKQPPDTSSQAEPTKQPKYTFSNEKSYSYEAVKNNSSLLENIKRIKTDFKVEDIATSFPVAASETETLGKVTVYSGCEEHNCGGTGLYIAVPENSKLCLLAEKSDFTEGFEYFGNCSEEMKDLLREFYRKN